VKYSSSREALASRSHVLSYSMHFSVLNKVRALTPHARSHTSCASHHFDPRVLVCLYELIEVTSVVHRSLQQKKAQSVQERTLSIHSRFKHTRNTMAVRNSPPPSKEMSRGKSVRKSTTIKGAVAYLSYSGQTKVDPMAHLSSLTDNRSNHPAVARSCLQLNQYVGSDQTSPIHDAMHAKTMNSMFSALSECLQSHQDRRCRILAAKTLALCARATFAKIRHSPLLFAVRDGTLHRLEDEVGTDIPVALCTAALDDHDDGVSASAVEALGILTLTSSAMVGTIVDDLLLRQIEGIAHNRPSPYSPSLADLSDEDPSIPQMELQSRVFENVLLPRIWRLVKRIIQFASPDDTLRTIPFLTSALVHLVKLMPNSTLGMDRATFAKRWIEVDILGLVTEVVTDVIIPACQSSNDSGLAYLSALAGLRLAHVCPYTSWSHAVCTYSARVVMQELSARPSIVENTLSLLSALLISLRALPLAERMTSLEVAVNEVRFLPATTLVPMPVTSAGIKIGKYMRRSARMGIMSEIALSILIDGPSEGLRSKYLKDYLSAPEVVALLISRRQMKNSRKWTSSQSVLSASNDGTSDSNSAPGGKTPNEAFTGTHVAEEFVLAFCSVASIYGRKVMGRSRQSRQAQEWLRCALAILSSGCSACVNWKPRTSVANEQEEDDNVNSLYTMLAACQASYVQLLYECFHAVGFLSSTSSVALHLFPLSTPPRMFLLEELSLAIASLNECTLIKGSQFAFAKDISALADQFLDYKFSEGIPSRHVRIALIAVLADRWVQSLDSERASRSGDASNLNEMTARDLLATLSSEISSLCRNLHQGTGDSQVNLKYLDVCVACAESIALMACDWARRHGSSPHGDAEGFRSDVDEDVTLIVSTAIAALEGKNLRDNDETDHVEPHSLRPYPMLPICAEAVKRIQSVTVGQGINTYGVKPAIHSLLVTTAGRDFNRRLANNDGTDLPTRYADVRRSPFIVTGPQEGVLEPIFVGDAGIHAYFVQYCLQVMRSRIDQSLQSSALLDVDGPNIRNADGEERDGVIRARNWLRLEYSQPSAARLTPRGSRVSCVGAVKTLSGASDPVTFVIAYSMRRCPRYDCEMEFKTFVTLRVHNVTAVKIPLGIRMDLRVTQQRSAFEVEDDEEGGGDDDHVLAAHTAVFKHEIKPGEQVTWEVALENWPIKGFLELHPSVTFREVDTEHVPPKMVSVTPFYKEEDNFSVEETVKRSDDDTDDNSASVEERTIGEDEDESTDVTLTAEPVQLSPMLGMQPCPLIFFRGRHGDVSSFRFMWYQMPHRMGEMILYPNQLPGRLIGSSSDDYGAAVARLACINPIDEFIDSVGTATRGWAFLTLTGKRLLCLMVESTVMDENNMETPTSTLHFRADDEALLFSILGSDVTRNAVVHSLTGNQWACASDDGGLMGF
jgi:hypothetical protein